LKMRAPEIDTPAALGLPHDHPARAEGVDEGSSRESNETVHGPYAAGARERARCAPLAKRFGD
jgi:hypothetical protein